MSESDFFKRLKKVRYWSQLDQWSIWEAICITHGYEPQENLADSFLLEASLNESEYGSDLRKIDDLIELLKRAIETHSFEVDDKHPLSIFKHDPPLISMDQVRSLGWVEKVHVRPIEFVSWTLKKSWNIPEPILDSFQKRGKPTKSEESKLKLKKAELDKHKCCALAGYIWSKEPLIKISAMARHEAIIKYGCDNKVYRDKDTIRNWISHLCPNGRRRGRPDKNTGLK